MGSGPTRPGSAACCAEGRIASDVLSEARSVCRRLRPATELVRTGSSEPAQPGTPHRTADLGSRLCRFSQAGFGRSVRRLTETVTRGGLIEWSRRSSLQWNNDPTRPIGDPARPPQRQQLACESHAEGAVPRNCSAWKARTVSSEASDVRTRLPPGATRSISEADSALTPIARKCALPVAASGLLQPREQWSSTAGS